MVGRSNYMPRPEGVANGHVRTLARPFRVGLCTCASISPGGCRPGWTPCATSARCRSMRREGDPCTAFHNRHGSRYLPYITSIFVLPHCLHSKGRSGLGTCEVCAGGRRVSDRLIAFLGAAAVPQRANALCLAKDSELRSAEHRMGEWLTTATPSAAGRRAPRSPATVVIVRPNGREPRLPAASPCSP